MQTTDLGFALDLVRNPAWLTSDTMYILDSANSGRPVSTIRSATDSR